MSFWQDIESHIASTTGTAFASSRQRNVGGGCINSGYIIDTNDSRYFAKLNTADKEEMFAAEAEGLREIVTSGCVRAPTPICWGTAGQQSYIVMEALTLGGRDKSGGALLGQQLAQMHQHTGTRFGWKRDNTIGSTPQMNDWDSNWVSFYQQRRLRYQVDLATQNGFARQIEERGNRLIEAMPAFFENYQPVASLLHGDLWGGNYATDDKGQPVIFDPAVYFGDREADLAMTELFGGFPARFYDAYNETWPLDPGYKTRKTLYNLYHILNHANLFGGGYAGQAGGMIDHLLSALK